MSKIYVMCASAIVIAAFLSFAPVSVLTKPCGDCKTWYFPVAENLLSGNGLVTKSGRAALDRPPGHVIILAGVISAGGVLGFTKEVSVYVFNTLMLSLSTLLLFSIADRYWGRKSSYVVAGLWCLCPFVIWFSNQPYTEVPYFVVLFASVLSFLKGVERPHPSMIFLIFCGGCLGVSLLIRPIGIGLVFLILIIYWLTERRHQLPQRIRVTSTIVVCLAVVVGPWIGFVYKQTGRLNPLSDEAHTAGSLVEGLTFGVRQKGYRIGIPLTPEIRQFMVDIDEIVFNYESLPDGKELYGANGEYDVRKSWNIIRIAANRLSGDPLLALRLVLFKIQRSWYGTDSNRYENLAFYLQTFYFLLIVPSIFLGWRNKPARSLIILVIGITAYFWFMAVLFTPLVRYMVPAQGLLFTLIPGLWHKVYKRSIQL